MVTVTFTTKRPAWIKSSPANLLKTFTEEIRAAGHEPLFYTNVSLLDRSDRRIAWAIGFFYTLSARTPLIAKILSTAER